MWKSKLPSWAARPWQIVCTVSVNIELELFIHKYIHTHTTHFHSHSQTRKHTYAHQSVSHHPLNYASQYWNSCTLSKTLSLESLLNRSRGKKLPTRMRRETTTRRQANWIGPSCRNCWTVVLLAVSSFIVLVNYLFRSFSFFPPTLLCSTFYHYYCCYYCHQLYKINTCCY